MHVRDGYSSAAAVPASVCVPGVPQFRVGDNTVPIVGSGNLPGPMATSSAPPNLKEQQNAGPSPQQQAQAGQMRGGGRGAPMYGVQPYVSVRIIKSIQPGSVTVGIQHMPLPGRMIAGRYASSRMSRARLY